MNDVHDSWTIIANRNLSKGSWHNIQLQNALSAFITRYGEEEKRDIVGGEYDSDGLFILDPRNSDHHFVVTKFPAYSAYVLACINSALKDNKRGKKLVCFTTLSLDLVTWFNYIKGNKLAPQWFTYITEMSKLASQLSTKFDITRCLLVVNCVNLDSQTCIHCRNGCGILPRKHIVEANAKQLIISQSTHEHSGMPPKPMTKLERLQLCSDLNSINATALASTIDFIYKDVDLAFIIIPSSSTIPAGLNGYHSVTVQEAFKEHYHTNDTSLHARVLVLEPSEVASLFTSKNPGERIPVDYFAFGVSKDDVSDLSQTDWFMALATEAGSDDERISLEIMTQGLSNDRFTRLRSVISNTFQSKSVSIDNL